MPLKVALVMSMVTPFQRVVSPGRASIQALLVEWRWWGDVVAEVDVWSGQKGMEKESKVVDDGSGCSS